MKERIRKVREELGLSRATFGKKLGVSGDVINNLERGRVETKDSIIKLICSVYFVSEEWLRTGEGEMFQQDNGSILKRVAQEYSLSDREQAVVASFLELSPDDRAAIMRYVDSLVKKLS